jgi:CheY-like chemotaxis protein
MPTYLGSLRFALKHLYDPTALRRSPLVELLGLSEHANAPEALRYALIATIESLQPQGDVPAQSRVWRTYEVLLYRYVQQCQQAEVADQLGITVRHVRREERAALESLAHCLERRFDLQVDWGQEPEDGTQQKVSEEVPNINDELAYLQEASSGSAVALAQLLSSILELIQPLASRHDVSVELAPVPEPAPLAAQPVILRQVLLSLLTVAIRQSASGRVLVGARAFGQQLQVVIHAQGLPQEEPLPADLASIAMAHRLTETCGGHLDLSPLGQPFAATLDLPAAEQVTVLVVDDNADALHLFQRYASDTRYRVVGARNAEQALALAGEISPALIILDVMMPGVDGWELLGRLTQHTLTGHIPILVCTILAQEELALSLGASGYIRKPVSRQAFLEALDRQLQPGKMASPGGPGPR